MAKEKSDSKSRYQVPNLERALLILELLSADARPLSLSQMSEILSLPKNSVFRICMTLLNRGYIERDPKTKAFTLSRKLMALGCTTVTEASLVEKSFDVMRDLRDQTEETVLIGTLLGAEGVVLDQAPGSHNFKFMVDPGTRFMLHTAAPGKAILAFLPSDECEKILKKMTFKRFSERTITKRRDFRRELERVRECGYGLDHAEDLVGQHCVAAPIFNSHGLPTASIWITAPSARVPEQAFPKVGKQIVSAAMRISERLGYTA
jgi:DNA-binding IclR family transcriptional regulator